MYTLRLCRLSLGTTNSSSSQLTILSTMAPIRSIGTITRAGDTIVGIFNTTAGGSTGGMNGMYSSVYELPAEGIDNQTSTKYLNFGVTGGFNTVAPAPGVGTGFLCNTCC